MKKVLPHISFYIQKYPTRISGYLSAIILNTATRFIDFPIGLLIPTAMLLILIGEGSQRLEDKKTIQALYTKNDPKKQDEEIIIDMMKDLHRREHDKDGIVVGTS